MGQKQRASEIIAVYPVYVKQQLVFFCRSVFGHDSDGVGPTEGRYEEYRWNWGMTRQE